MNLKPKILIVDDRAENLVALRTVLSGLDVELVEATSGNEALKATLKQEFALALLDIQMPEMDGYELASILREEEKTALLPFIFISAVYTDNLNIFKGYEKGAFSFITKPFQPEILINKVKFFIEKHQQEMALYELNKDLETKNNDLEFANNELESFTYSVSHDLRAPLRILNGYTSMLMEDFGGTMDEEGKRIVNVIMNSATKMNTLIDSLLELSRLGKKELAKRTVDMKALVKQVLVELQHDHSENIVIEVGDLPAARADIELIELVLVNLISNALKYSGKKESPHVEIGYQQEGEMTIYFVKDNGAGFDMKYANKLFGIFQRLHKRTDFEGIGIGLANVQRIVTRHGGRVWAEGKVNEGATFYFSLPE